jgi:hypothetical protein
MASSSLALLSERMSRCSHAHDDPLSWPTFTAAAVQLAVSHSSKHRNVTQRQKGFARWCNGTQTGLACEFLTQGTRFRIPSLLQQMNYTGASAEIGVWIGDFSASLLSIWRIGGLHLGVDPYLNYRDGCHRQGTAQWHCLRDQATFDRVYNDTIARFAKLAPTRYVPVRSMSLDAVAMLHKRTRFDFVYLDGRHDRQGLKEDLRAWHPRVCPGGILAGHDYTDSQVAAGLSEYFAELRADEKRQAAARGNGHSMGLRTSSPPLVAFITAENPASFVLFRPPLHAALESRL